MKAIFAALVVAVASVAVPVAGASPALADEPVTHCWQDLESGAGGCFDTYAEVLTDIALHAAVPRGDTADGITPLSTVIIGQVFEDANYGGSSFTFTASGDCDTNVDVDWELSAMPSGWNDRVSSFKSFGQCATKIWQDVGYGGSSYGFVVNSTYVGATLNDQASSIQWN